MSDTTVFDVLINQYRDMAQRHKDTLVEGGVEDYAQYKYLCGIVHGLALAERDVLDLQGRLEEM